MNRSRRCDVITAMIFIIQSYYTDRCHLELGVAQVGLDHPHVTELLLRILRRDGRGNNDILADSPVNRSSDTLLVSSLEGIDHSEDFRSVAAGRGWVQHNQTNLLGRVDDKDGTDRERNALLGNGIDIALIHHVVQEGDLAVGIGNNGELDVGVGNLIDVLDPSAVGAEVIGTLGYAMN